MGRPGAPRFGTEHGGWLPRTLNHRPAPAADGKIGAPVLDWSWAMSICPARAAQARIGDRYDPRRTSDARWSVRAHQHGRRARRAIRRPRLSSTTPFAQRRSRPMFWPRPCSFSSMRSKSQRNASPNSRRRRSMRPSRLRNRAASSAISAGRFLAARRRRPRSRRARAMIRLISSSSPAGAGLSRPRRRQATRRSGPVPGAARPRPSPRLIRSRAAGGGFLPERRLDRGRRRRRRGDRQSARAACSAGHSGGGLFGGGSNAGFFGGGRPAAATRR